MKPSDCSTFQQKFSFLQSSTGSAEQNKMQPLSVASWWLMQAHAATQISDTILSRPHASDWQGGRDPWH